MTPDRRQLRIPKVERTILDVCLRAGVCVRSGAADMEFSRSSAAMVRDCDGVYRLAKIGEARFPGARRVENKFRYSNDLTNALWLKLGTGTPATVVESAVAPPVPGSRVFLVDVTGAADDRIAQTFSATSPAGVYILSFWIRSVSGTGKWGLAVGGTTLAFDVTETWQRVQLPFTNPAIQSINVYPAYRAAVGSTLFTALLSQLQFEYIPNASAGNIASEYVSTDVLTNPKYHGAFADGVKYFDCYLGNTVAANVVTEAKGTPIPESSILGCHSEPSEINQEIWSNTYSVTAMDSVLGQTDPAGGNMGALFTETAGTNHFCYQSSLVSPTVGMYVNISVFVKRVTANKVQLTPSANWGDPTYYANYDLTNGTLVGQGAGVYAAGISNEGNGWYRLWMTVQATTTIGGASVILSTIANNNDTRLPTKANEGWSFVRAFGQCVTNSRVPTSPIPTVTGVTTRALDTLTHSVSAELAQINPQNYSMYAEASIDSYDASVFNNLYVSQIDNSFKVAWFRYQDKVSFEKRLSNVAHTATYTYTPALKTLFKAAVSASSALGHMGGAAGNAGSLLRDTLDQRWYFGSTGQIGSSMRGTIKQFAIYDQGISASRIRELTQ